MPTSPTAALLEDPGAFTEPEDAPRAHRRASAARLSPAAKRSAVDAVLNLMGRSQTSTKKSAALPSARTRQAIERLIAYGTVEQLERSEPDLRSMARDLFDWNSPTGQTRATKQVVKAVAGILTAKTTGGRSLYPQAVEMIAFAAAAAPLLQPDRIARLLAVAGTVRTAFAPDRYTVQLFASLATALSEYQEQRREQLLVSLWRQSHDGRWWDMTSGVVRVKHGKKSHALGDDDEVIARDLREILAGAEPGTAAATDAVKAALLAGTLPYRPAIANIISELPHSDEVEERMADVAVELRSGHVIDPDMAVHASAIPWLAVAERPESPIGWIVKTLVRAMTPDPVTGEAELQELPAKPKEFSELFPAAGTRRFPFMPEVLALHGTALGHGRARPVVIELVHNAAELADNRDYMGNCTWSYKSRMESGTYILFKLWDGTDCYNAAAEFRYGEHTWTVNQINSRFNRGGVPDSIRNDFTNLVAALPHDAYVTHPDGQQVKPSASVGYALA